MKRIENNWSGIVCRFLSCCLLAAGCTATDVEDAAGPSGKLKEVEARFSLNVLSTVTPRTRSLSFRSAGQEVGAPNEATPDEAAPDEAAPDEAAPDEAAPDEAAPDEALPATKATAPLTDVEEAKLQNMWIGQYDAAGTLLYSEYIAELPADASQIKIQLKKPKGNSHIYLVANAGDLTTATREKNETDFKALTYSDGFANDGLPTGSHCIMTGFLEKEITGDISESISLTRALAKVSFTYTIKEGEGEKFSFKPTGLSLCGVPAKLQYVASETQLADVTYNSYTAGSTATEVYWYLPENPAGEGTNTTEGCSDKTKTGDGTTDATYICLTGDATQGSTEYKGVCFKLYVGDGVNNYNVVRNNYYSLSVTLSGIDFSDKRVTIGELPEMSNPAELEAAKGATTTFDITIQPGNPWSFTVPQWLTATVKEATASGGEVLQYHGPAEVTFATTTANPTNEVRTTDFIVDGKTYSITQAGSRLTVGSAIDLAATSASTGSSTFTLTKGLSWSAQLATVWGDWLAWVSGASSSGTEATGEAEDLRIESASANPSAAARSGTITVNGADGGSLTQTIAVTQAASTATGSTKAEKEKATAADNLSGTFTATTGLPWTASVANDATDWLSLPGTTSGTTSGTTIDATHTVTYATTFNYSKTIRTGILTVQVGNAAESEHPGPQAKISVTQDSSAFWVYPLTLELAATANSTGSVQLTATTGLPWTLTRTTGDENITTATQSGNGDATISFSAAENKGVARSSTFTLAVTGVNPARTLAVEVKQKAGFLPPPAGSIAGGYQVAPANTTTGTMTWDAAITACQNLTAEGFDDWTLPSKDALLAIYADKGKLGAAYTFVRNFHWSSTENGSANAWYVTFGSGDTTYGSKTLTKDVRCVRGI